MYSRSEAMKSMLQRFTRWFTETTIGREPFGKSDSKV